MAQQLNEIGIEVKQISSVSDKVEEIKDFFIFYFKFFGPVRGEAKCLIPR